MRRDESGAWVNDYEEPDPDPPPFTTIAWRLVHIAGCKVMHHEYAFGAGRLTFPDLKPPSTVATAMARLADGRQLLRTDLADPSGAALDDPVRTNWDELWLAWKIFWAMIDHDAHHGAEIGCLRDLYRLKV